MKSAELIQIVLVTVGLYFTLGQLKGLNIQLAETRRSLQANTYMAFHQNLRELISMAINDPTLLKPKEASPKPQEEERRRRYTGLFLAHARNAFVQRQLGALPESVWAAMKTDLKGFFANPEVQEVWKERQRFQPKEFREFIEKEILR